MHSVRNLSEIMLIYFPVYDKDYGLTNSQGLDFQGMNSERSKNGNQYFSLVIMLIHTALTNQTTKQPSIHTDMFMNSQIHT